MPEVIVTFKDRVLFEGLPVVKAKSTRHCNFWVLYCLKKGEVKRYYSDRLPIFRGTICDKK